jgi:hypothetical protein
MLGISAAAGDLFRRWLHEFFVEGADDPQVIIRATAEVKAFPLTIDNQLAILVLSS